MLQLTLLDLLYTYSDVFQSAKLKLSQHIDQLPAHFLIVYLVSLLHISILPKVSQLILWKTFLSTFADVSVSQLLAVLLIQSFTKLGHCPLVRSFILLSVREPVISIPFKPYRSNFNICLYECFKDFLNRSMTEYIIKLLSIY